MYLIVLLFFNIQNSNAESSGLDAVQTFGPLSIQTEQYINNKRTGQANYKPWSGWWFPYKETSLYEPKGGQRSPLERYEQYYKSTRGRSSGALEFERSLHEQLSENYSGFDGLCGGWALASILFAEPTKTIIRNGIEFRPVDQKALLSKAYEQVQGLKMYGNRYLRFRDDPHDILPHQLLKVIDVELFSKKLPFIIDHDPDKAVWHVPVYSAEITFQNFTTEPELNGTLWLQTIESRGLARSEAPGIPDMTGSMTTARKYTFKLKGQWQSRSTFLVQTSEWTGSSLDDHPDYVLTRPEKNDSIELKLSNPNLHLDVLQEIFQSTP